MAIGASAILSIRIVANSRDAARELRRTSRAVNQFQRDVDTMSGGVIGASSRATASFARIAAGAISLTGAIAPVIGVVGSLGIGLAGLGAVAAPGLAAVALGLDGIKKAASSISPQFDSIKAAVSSTFEKEMTPAFAKLGGLLDQITPGMQRVASAVSGAFSGMVDTITGPGKAALDTLIAGGETFVRTLSPGLNRLTEGVLKFGETAAQAAGNMGDSLGGVIAKFGDALGKIPVAAFDGFAATLDGIGNLMGPLVGLFSQLGVVMGPIVGQLFTQLATVVSGLTGPLSDIAATVGNALVTAFGAIAPVLPQLVDSFSKILTAIAPLAGPLAELAAALGVALANALVSIAPTLASFATTIGTVATALTPFAPVILGVVAAIAAFNLALTIGTAAITAYNVIMGIWRAATVAFTAVQFALNVVLAANPIGVIVVAVIALVAALVLAYNKSETFRNICQTLGTVVSGYFQLIWAAIQTVWQILVTVAGYVGGALTGAFNSFKSVGTSAINAVKSVVDGVRSAFNAVKSAVEAVIGAISRIRFPSAPGWMSALFSAPEVGPTFIPPDVTRFYPAGFETFAAAPPDLTAASFGLSGSGRVDFGGGRSMNITNVQLTIEGALDPVAVGDQIVTLLKKHGVTVGIDNSARFK